MRHRERRRRARERGPRCPRTIISAAFLPFLFLRKRLRVWEEVLFLLAFEPRAMPRAPQIFAGPAPHLGCRPSSCGAEQRASGQPDLRLKAHPPVRASEEAGKGPANSVRSAAHCAAQGGLVEAKRLALYARAAARL